MELCRAREEVERLNIEIKRLRTAMRDEALEYRDAISTTVTHKTDAMFVASPMFIAYLINQECYQAQINYDW